MNDVFERAAALASDAEVVTHALLRKVPLGGPGAGDAGVMGLITLDNGHDHRRPNTFGATGLLELNAAIDAALADPDVTSIGITGKPYIFAAGADLGTVGAHGPSGVRVIAELGHAIFRKLSETLASRVLRSSTGWLLAAGLEVALHCDYRTVQDSAGALGLPEVMLGLIPGWGGAWLVPQLLGPTVPCHSSSTTR